MQGDTHSNETTGPGLTGNSRRPTARDEYSGLYGDNDGLISAAAGQNRQTVGAQATPAVE